MDDALRPSKEAFDYTLRASYQLWSTHFNTSDSRLPLECVSEAGKVELSKEAPLSEWPGVHGISGYDEGNHIAVLFLAWAYILSAKWAELLDRSDTHQCLAKYSDTCQEPEEAVQPEVIEVDLPPDASEAEIVWWNAVLSGTPAWEISVEYESEKFISPWSVSLAGAISMRAKQGTHQSTTYNPPSSTTAFKYLTRFCSHHRIYAQCTAALSASFFTRNGRLHKSPTLPIPRPAKNPKDLQSTPTSPKSISALISEHENLLPYYMTLMSNMWLTTLPAIKSIFFNPDIPCNLVSAWTNAAFAIISPIVKQDDIPRLLNGLSARQPRVASLWLGAAVMGTSSIYLKECEQGMMTSSLQAEAWMGTTTTFLTQPPGLYANDADSVQREDECKLLFLATPTDGSYNHGYITTWPWKPFGSTKTSDADILLREHLGCGCHALEYEGWDWELRDGSRVEDTGVEARFASLLSPTTSTSTSTSAATSMCVSCPRLGLSFADLPALPKDCEYDLYSEQKSDNPTRGIFCWLRLHGFPANEKRIYQHSWVVIAMDSDEEVDEDESDDSTAGVRTERVRDWLDGVSDVERVVEVETEDYCDTG
ncbi:unnamed protein product [Penicillium egyptiacum]|uniref:Uncharacterized protein n=1 Tax=Penicillium egyptiacum TaxID=1303716 RepID=A0A9W4KNP8_9EURO|nr:unnamed protein product [Penicillium egyptiacum]